MVSEISGRPTMNPSERPVRRMPVPLSSIACRVAWIRSTASVNSNRGSNASPVESSIESPAIPVAVAAATLARTAVGTIAKPPSKSALTGTSTPWTIDRKWVKACSSDTPLAGRPKDQASPALVVASAGKPSSASTRALPRSHGLGSGSNQTDGADEIRGNDRQRGS
jgi:hypothetical protein